MLVATGSGKKMKRHTFLFRIFIEQSSYNGMTIEPQPEVCDPFMSDPIPLVDDRREQSVGVRIPAAG